MTVYHIERNIQTLRYDMIEDRPVQRDPRGILLHSCEGTRASSIPWLTTDRRSRVSCTYYVCRDGDIYQFAPDTYRTWHGGAGTRDGVQANDLIGIEIEHREGQDYPKVQMDALAWLCRTKIAEWRIPQLRIAAHRWTARAVGRTDKSDPTDWDDRSLKIWIDDLYRATASTRYEDVWGDDAPYFHDWGIPTAFRRDYDAGKSWGKAYWPEHIVHGKVFQAFEKAIVTWSQADGVEVYRK